MVLTIADGMPGMKYTESSFGELLQNLRKARGLTRAQLAEDGFSPVPAVIGLAKAHNVTTNELLGVKQTKDALVEDNSEARRQWKRFQMIAPQPERDQKAVVHLMNSLAAGSAVRKNGSAPAGEHRHGR